MTPLVFIYDRFEYYSIQLTIQLTTHSKKLKNMPYEFN